MTTIAIALFAFVNLSLKGIGDYFEIRPGVSSNEICGVGMGPIPSNAYDVVRSEDIVFLAEAYRERCSTSYDAHPIRDSLLSTNAPDKSYIPRIDPAKYLYFSKNIRYFGLTFKDDPIRRDGFSYVTGAYTPYTSFNPLIGDAARQYTTENVTNLLDLVSIGNTFDEGELCGSNVLEGAVGHVVLSKQKICDLYANLSNFTYSVESAGLITTNKRSEVSSWYTYRSYPSEYRYAYTEDGQRYPVAVSEYYTSDPDPFVSTDEVPCNFHIFESRRIDAATIIEWHNHYESEGITYRELNPIANYVPSKTELLFKGIDDNYVLSFPSPAGTNLEDRVEIDSGSLVVVGTFTRLESKSITGPSNADGVFDLNSTYTSTTNIDFVFSLPLVYRKTNNVTIDSHGVARYIYQASFPLQMIYERLMRETGYSIQGEEMPAVYLYWSDLKRVSRDSSGGNYSHIITYTTTFSDKTQVFIKHKIGNLRRTYIEEP